MLIIKMCQAPADLLFSPPMRRDQPAHRNRNVLIIGAGPAGLMAALAAARHGTKVILCEQMPKPGLKLLATGGGRCNITNTSTPDAFMEAFGRNGRFMQPALELMNADRLRALLAELGVATSSPDGFHVYPSSNKSSDVLRALLDACDRAGVERRTNCAVRSLIIKDGAICGIETADAAINADAVILACGGRSYPELGATGTGYELARAAGHTIADPLPVLVSLHTEEHWPHACTGVSMPNVRAWVDLPRQSKSGCTGDLLFTHRGVSGPVILDLSRDVVPLLARHGQVPIRVALNVNVSASRWRTRDGGRLVRKLLGEHMPASLAKALMDVAGIREHTAAATLTREQEKALGELLEAIPLTIASAGGFDEAIVTRGGVSLREVNPRTLESRLVKGLFFAGELLDLAGPCGGFNLQWAFSSGNLAGHCAV